MSSPYLILVTDATGADDALWWGKNRSGYTRDFDRAGRYTEDEYLDAVPRSKQNTNVLVHVDDIEPKVRRSVPRSVAHAARATTQDAQASAALRFMTSQDDYTRLDVRALQTLQFSAGSLIDFNGWRIDGVHLVRYTDHGTPGPTLCGIDRFSNDPSRPGWSLGGGVTGPNIKHTPCPGCADTARQTYPGVPVMGSVGGREMATHLSVRLIDTFWNKEPRYATL